MKFMTIAVAAIYIVIVVFTVRNLIKKKYWREMVSSLILLTFGFTLLVLQTMNVKIPSPGAGIKYFVENILHLGYK